MKDQRLRVVGRDEAPLIDLPIGTLIKWERLKTWLDPRQGKMVGYNIRFTERPLDPEHRGITDISEGESYLIYDSEDGKDTFYRFVTYSFEMPYSDLPIAFAPLLTLPITNGAQEKVSP